MTEGGKWVERESRSAKWLDVIIRRSDGQDFPAVMTNVSNGGCRLRSGETLRAGEAIHIEVPRMGGFSALVRWSNGSDAGAIFGRRSGTADSTSL